MGRNENEAIVTGWTTTLGLLAALAAISAFAGPAPLLQIAIFGMTAGIYAHNHDQGVI